MTNQETYTAFINLWNRRDYDGLPDLIDVEQYREYGAQLSPGWTTFGESLVYFKQMTDGIPTYAARIVETQAHGDILYARLVVTGTNRKALFGIPATGASFAINMFDYVKFEEGKIVERIQLRDNYSQLHQMYGGVLGKVGLAASALLGILLVRSLKKRG